MLSEEQVNSIKQQLLKQIASLPPGQQEALRRQIESATPQQIEQFISHQSREEECLFCSIVKGETDTVKIYEDDYVIGFLDITPLVPGQVIIAPKEHYQFIFQMPDQVLWELFRVVKLIMPFVVNATKSQGISIYIAQGQAAGQRTEHLTVNLVPRFENDRASFVWERNQASKDDLEKVARIMIEGIKKYLSEEKEKLEKKVRDELSKKASSSEKIEEYPRRRA